MRGRVGTLGLLALALWARPVVAEGASQDAWDRSVALEAQGDLSQAQSLMVQQYGDHPENYWAGLRLAYLALVQGHFEEARSRYQALRARPEAEGDTDVLRGLASAMAGVGWERAKHGERAQARAEFYEALAIDPANQSARKGLTTVQEQPWFVSEAWSGATGNSLGRDKWTGWASYAQVAVAMSDLLTVRTAARFVHYWNDGQRSRAAGQKGRLSSYNLDEEFLGLAYEARLWGAEVVGARSDTDESAAILGGAGRLRLGATWGATVEGAVLSAKDGPTNLQARPMGFLWIGAHLGAQAGVRLTQDDRGKGMSGNAGLTLVLDPITLLMEGHVGDEYWSFGFSGPSIMSFDARTTYGGCATVLWALGKRVRLALQGEGERLNQDGISGTFWSASAGVQLSLGAQ